MKKINTKLNFNYSLNKERQIDKKKRQEKKYCKKKKKKQKCLLCLNTCGVLPINLLWIIIFVIRVN